MVNETLTAVTRAVMPAVAIEEPVWLRMVSYPSAPEYETERFHQLIYQAFKAWSAAKPGTCEVTFGFFCLPHDGDMKTPLWQALRLKHESDRLLIALDA
ncbi:hypothetical protein AA106_20895 [Photorhabdus laumondii subsp. laumondii]|nr:hypothetical protein AA106_20895 [Photorhabdus laumondii subsp. laumondii]